MVEKWTSADGNLCFRFQEREPLERPWIVIVFVIVLAAVPVFEYYANGSLHSLTPSFIAFVFVFLWWLTIPLKANESVIEKTVHELMDTVVASDARTFGTEVVNSRVHYDTKGTYAIILGRWFLVLLKNGQVWEYPIIYHSPTNDMDGYYECKKGFSVSDNPEHIKFIKPVSWKGMVVKCEMSDKAKLWLLIFAIIAIGGLTFWGVYRLAIWLKWWSLLWMVGYGFLYELINWLSDRHSGKVMKVIECIVSAPVTLAFLGTGSSSMMAICCRKALMLRL